MKLKLKQGRKNNCLYVEVFKWVIIHTASISFNFYHFIQQHYLTTNESEKYTSSIWY